MALSDAPLDKTREDWLQRCRALLEAARAVQKTPTHEVDLPASWGSVEPVPTPPSPPPLPPETDAVSETHFLVVETRNSAPEALVSPAVDAPAPVASVRVEPERSEPERVAAPRVAPAARSAKATIPPPTRPRRVEAAPRIWPWAVAGLVVLALAIGAWQFVSTPKEVAPPKPAQPQRVPALSEPAAPLTAADFQLVLLRQQHEGVLEDLDFYLWLSEQEDAR